MGCRDVVRIVLAAGFEILVEGRQLDHANAMLGGALTDFNHPILGRLFLQLDPLPGDGDQHMLAIGAGRCRQHVEANLGVACAANLVDHIVNTPADHVFHCALAALAHCSDAIADLDLARLVGRTAGHDGTHHHVVSLLLQHRADALKRQPHGDIEVFRRARGHVIGVRIQRIGIRPKKCLEHVFAGQLVRARFQFRVTLVEGLADFRHAFASEF